MSDYRATVLIMEEDVDYISLIRQTFTNSGYKVVSVFDIAAAFASCSQNQVALALIDINASRWDGVAISLALQNMAGIPVVALVQTETTSRQIKFLIEKAEEYIAKPFADSELLLRARPFLRSWHGKRQPRNLRAAGDLILDLIDDKLWVCDHSSLLTPNECKLLNYFMQHPNQTLSKTELIQAVWKYHFYNEENALRVLIRRLRQKLEEDVSHPTRLRTIQGIGYQFQLINPFADARI